MQTQNEFSFDIPDDPRRNRRRARQQHNVVDLADGRAVGGYQGESQYARDVERSAGHGETIQAPCPARAGLGEFQVGR